MTNINWEKHFDLIDSAYEFNENEKKVLRNLKRMCEAIQNGSAQESIILEVGITGTRLKLTLRKESSE